ncbi:MAG: protein kinase [Planctomycetota bacterium]
MKPELCNVDQLTAFLDGHLGADEELELTEHLSSCDVCAQELERRAASLTRWSDAQRFLSRSPEVIAPLSETVDRGNQLPLSVRQVLKLIDPTDEPTRLGRIDGFEIVGVVGCGAMGVVLKASERALDRVVALKVMNPSLAACATARQRFAREAKAAAGVLHPNVIAIHGVSIEHALPYLVMPYVTGTSLQQRIDHQGHLDCSEILRIGSQVAAGLAAAHSKGVIHRDIKPANIMLDSGVETALITDFGLARTIDEATMTRSGVITGTPEYMSPEQARGDVIEFASDLFSLGSVLYTLCTGQRPFRAHTSFGVLRKITDQSPTPIRELNPDIPKWLCGIVERLHMKSPGERPTAIEIRDLLEGCLAHVYQPDRVSLPAALSNSAKTDSSFFTPTIKNGVIAIMAFSFLALLAFAVFPNSFAWGPNEVATPQHEILVPDDPEVFKIHKLQLPNPDKRGKLIIDINRGSIDVVGHDRPEVIIEVLTPKEFQKTEGSKKSTSRVQFAPRYDLETRKAENCIDLDTYNQDYVLDLRIKVPHNIDLSLDTYRSGYLSVKNVSGTIDTHSQNCDIKLLNISGTATAYSYNGNLTVQFEDVAKDAKLDFESYNGSIYLTLPSLTEASAAIASGVGSYVTDFEIERVPSEKRDEYSFPPIKNNKIDEYQLVTINGGGIPIRIECEKGDVKLRKGMAKMNK